MPHRRERDRALTERWRKGDERAREQLLAQMMPMAQSLARRYARSADEVDDLVQVASVGLLKAIDRFEPERGFMLSTYAHSVLVGEIKRWFRDSSWAVKVPRGAKELVIRIETALPKLTNSLGRSPTITEIAAEVGADNEQVLEALEARSAASVASLDQTMDDDDAGLDNLTGAEDPGYDAVEQRASLEPTLRKLSKRERTVLELRFQDGMTQGEIASRIGVSQMQVSRILRQALDRAAGSLAA